MKKKFENEEEQVRSLYIEGLEPQYRALAYSRFREGKSLQDVYREISELRRKAKDRGMIPATRKLIEEEKVFLRELTPEMRKKAYASLMKGRAFELVQSDVAEWQNCEKILKIMKEEVAFTLKIIIRMQSAQMPVPFEYFQVAMNFDVLGEVGHMDYELFGKMGLAMVNTYDENGEGSDYQQLRFFMFEKIGECFERGFVPHPLMFDFMMKGDWISDKTFLMLHNHALELTTRGMSAKLVIPLKRMLEKRRTGGSEKRPFTRREENYFISLINLFEKG